MEFCGSGKFDKAASD